LSEIAFEVKENEGYTVIEFELTNTIAPEVLKTLRIPTVKATKGVVLSGRGPIWMYCYLTHYYHPTKFVATFDPRLGGAVIVETHSRAHRIGDIIKIEG